MLAGIRKISARERKASLQQEWQEEKGIKNSIFSLKWTVSQLKRSVINQIVWKESWKLSMLRLQSWDPLLSYSYLYHNMTIHMKETRALNTCRGFTFFGTVLLGNWKYQLSGFTACKYVNIFWTSSMTGWQVLWIYMRNIHFGSQCHTFFFR